MQDMFFSSTTRSMDGYFRETSYGMTSAAGNTFGPYTLAGVLFRMQYVPNAVGCDRGRQCGRRESESLHTALHGLPGQH